ncbi:hypothetical protein FHQ28_06775 [Pasteurellaceae bacterium USgator11]|nr:hypothetical protein FHQ20_03865 [Pasteurellaceae bacterium USgator41]TNG97241.1 hypothetical protein FHQ19_00170 [Pasteurellaceae bacterium UScroc12]TNG99819.1 hypothetical protein FHQ24_05100 [Pasteurellaceae bacterium UScroc31]TNH01078.1 hypothetical protein FHQ28_06775 [Pasteurellaceae bacterium USgator11]
MKKLMSLLLVTSSIVLANPPADNLIYDSEQHQTLKSGTIDYFIQSKNGAGAKNNAVCEDGLFFSDHYLAVFDGATDKSGKKYDGKKGGRVARDIIQAVFQELPPNTPKEEVLTRINQKYQEFYAANSDMDFEKNPLFRPTATLIWYNFDSNELVAIGDSKARIDGVPYNDGEKLVDTLNSALRVKVIEELKLSDEQIAEKDLGRYYIMPLLQRQSEFQNNPDAPEAFQFWAIDGFNIPPEQLRVWQFDKKPRVIELVSDGYEEYPANAVIADYETALESALKNDPMRVKNPSTKGISKGNYSFDDRAVLIYRAR